MSLTGMNLFSPLPCPKSPSQTKRPFSAFRVAGRVLALATLWTAASGFAQNYTFSTFAGVSGTPGSANGTGSANGKPLFNSPGGIVVDKDGNSFVADTRNHSIRKISASGVVTTFVGISGIDGSLDATGNAARFSSPQGAAISSDGTMYVADYGSSTIRKITSAGVVTTLAGGAYTVGATDDTGTAARFNHPISVAVDKSGNVYVADAENNLIRKVTSAGLVTTIAGSSSLFHGSTDGKGSSALFHRPHGIVVDANGILYVSDSSNNTIRKIAADGTVSTLAGKAGVYGNADGTGTAAQFDFPSSMVITAAGDIIYVTDEANHTIRKIVLPTATVPTATVTTVAGSAGTPGFVDGIGSAARFNHPAGLALSADEKTIFVADYSNNLIRTLTLATGNVTSLAGVAGIAGSAEGTGYSLTTASLLFSPSATAVDSARNVYIADTNNQTIRKFSSAGVATTFAGGVQLIGATDANGTAARFNNPSGIAVSPTNVGTVYVADTASHTIRKITSTGDVTTLAGVAGYAGESMTTTISYAADPITNTTLVTTTTRTITTRNPTLVTTTTSTFSTTSGIVAGATPPATTTVTSSLFNLPSSVAVDKNENVYVADYNNHNIRKITPAGVVTVFAGTGSPGSANLVGTSASFNHPRGLAIDSASTFLYVADLGNQAIRKIDLTSGAVTLYAGTVGDAGSTDGASAKFNGPSALVVDSSGVVFVADSNNHTIRAISASGAVSTIAGSAPNPGYADGTGSAVRFNQPMGISVDTTTNALYVADYRNNTIRVGLPTATGPGNQPPSDTGTAPTGNSKVSLPTGIAPDLTSGGYIFVADTANNCIKKIASDGSVTIYAGKNQIAGFAEGIGTAATFDGPSGLINDGFAALYVADRNNARIRKINLATAEVTTIAGSLSGVRDNVDGVGTAAAFKSPVSLSLDTLGNLYVVDSSTHTIRKINLTAIAATTAVAATPGSPATPTASAVLATPAKAAVPAIVANTVTTIAGLANTTGETDGVGSAARFSSPHGISVDGSGFLYVTDTNNNTIRLINTNDAITYAADGYSIGSITPAYTVTTLAGSAGISGSYDGPGNLALFSRPTGIVSNGTTLYVTDTGNSLIRSISNRKVSTIAGIAGVAGYRDGANNTALFNHPEAISGNGAIYVADTGNSSIRILSGTFVYGLSLKDATSTTTTPTNTTTPAAASSSGGGSMNSWFVGGLALLLFVSGKTRRRSIAG